MMKLLLGLLLLLAGATTMAIAAISVALWLVNPAIQYLTPVLKWGPLFALAFLLPVVVLLMCAKRENERAWGLPQESPIKDFTVGPFIAVIGCTIDPIARGIEILRSRVPVFHR